MNTSIKQLHFTTKSKHWLIVVFVILSCISSEKRNPAVSNNHTSSSMSKNVILATNFKHYDTTFNNGNSNKLDTIAKLISKQDANGNIIAQYYAKIDSTGKEKIDCPCSYFFPNGSLSKEIKLIDGSEFFSIKHWRADGSLWRENYFDTIENKWVWLFYYKNGQKQQQKIDKKPFSQITRWYENGQKAEEKIPNYNNSKKGIYRRWSETGKLLEEEIFDGIYTEKEMGLKHINGDTTGISNYVQKLMRERQEKETDIKKSALKKYQRHKWSIRGHSPISDTESIYLPHVNGLIDTVCYYKDCGRDLKWDTALCRIPKSGEYKVRIIPCNCSFTMIKVIRQTQSAKKLSLPNLRSGEFEEDLQRNNNNVIIKLVNSDGKVYLGCTGYNGQLLNANAPVHFTDDCEVLRSAICYAASSDIAIYEIKALNTNEEVKDELTLYCSGDSVPDNYKIVNCLTSFRFIWLDDKPLVIIFDAKSRQITLQ